MPPIADGAMTPAQRAAAHEIATGRRGGVYGPFVPALRSPELTRRLQSVGDYLRYDSTLEPRLREMIILLTARGWTQDFEWQVHAPIGLDAGLAPATVTAIADGRRPDVMRDDEALVWDLVAEIDRTRSVSDSTYTRAVATLTEQGLIDLIGTVGYYTTLAMIMNVARTPPPDGRTPVLRRLPD